MSTAYDVNSYLCALYIEHIPSHEEFIRGMLFWSLSLFLPVEEVDLNFQGIQWNGYSLRGASNEFVLKLRLRITSF